METVTLDAKEQRIGRLATKIALLLSGKERADYAPQRLPPLRVRVINVSKLAIDPRKLEKLYERYSGFFGGRKTESMGSVIARRGNGEIVRRAVYGMLADNRLRAQKMRRLQLEE